MAEYIEKATLLSRVIIPSICSCVQGPTAERLKKFCIDTVNNVSAADVAPVVHAHWIRFKERDSCYIHMRCSACSAYWSDPSHSDYFRYCPNCGAKMDEEEHNNV